MVEHDYMKVISVLAKSFKASREPDVVASHEGHDIFEVAFHSIEGDIKYKVYYFGKHNMDIIIGKGVFKSIKFEKWLSNVEYDLEQAFHKNVKLESQTGITDYRIKLTM